MTLEQLIAQFRVDSEDKLEPYLFADESVIQWLNEAQEEACVRALLLKDWATPAVCSIAVLADVSAYQLHESVINITRAEFTATGETDGTLLWQADEYELDRMEPSWRKLSATPTAFIHHDTALRIGCLPPAGTLALEVNRLPLWPMENDSDTPEIAAIHHRHLVLWALHRAFSIPDSETVDANRAALAELQFTRTFGHRPDANTRRGHESSRPHHNSSCWMG